MKDESAPKSAPQTAAKWSNSTFPQGTVTPRRRTVEEEAAMRELAEFLGRCRRRREAAALRLPPLADGRRDPLGPVTDGAGT